MAGGIGVHVHNIRAAGSPIYGTGGTSNGLVPMLRNFDATASYVDQGGGKRKGSFAIYLEPWHADIFDWLDLKRNTGKDERRARSLFFGLWTPDLFMERVRRRRNVDPHGSAPLPRPVDCHGEEFRELYEKYENEGRGHQQIRAQELWKKILELQVETSMPYILYKDAANRKSNQQNLGVIKSSNLCTEIMEYTSPDEIAVCNLGSVALPAFVHENGAHGHGIDHEGLHEVAKTLTATSTASLTAIIILPETEEFQYAPPPHRHRCSGLG